MRYLLILLLLAGCSTKLVVVDQRGMPVPNEVVTISSLYDISCSFHFIRLYEKGKESIYPEYLPMGKWNKLPRDTRAVALVLHITNPHAEHIRVVKHMRVGMRRVKEVVYEGNAISRVFQLKGPVRSGLKVELSADILIRNLPVIAAGRALYQMK